MGTRVYYGPILLENVTTRDWTEDVQYDQSGTDAIGAKYRLSFEGIAHIQSLSDAVAFISPVTGAFPSLAGLWRQIEVALLTPRQELRVLFDSQIMLVCHPSIASNINDPHRDTDNGPKPSNVKITHVAGSAVVRVQFTIECTKVLCSDRAAGPVISNRWAVQEEMDHNFSTTRTIRGRLRLSSGFLAGHIYRGLVVPTLENGFRRERLNYTVDPNNLDCDYEVVDRQVHTSAPAPATSMSCSHAETTNDGVTLISGVDVRLEGAPNIDKRDLIVRAVQIADARLNFLGDTNYLIEQFSLIDLIGESNAVELVLRIKRVGLTADEWLSNLSAGNRSVQALGSKLELPAMPSGPGNSAVRTDYDAQISTPPALFGYDPHGDKRDPNVVLLLLHCYLQSPCSDQHSIGQTSTHSIKKEKEKGTPPKVTGKRGHLVPTSKKSLFSKPHREHLYTYATVKNSYRLRTLRAHMPIARRISTLATRDATSVALSLGAPLGQRIIEIDAERVGDWPQLPEPLDTYTDETGMKGALIDHELIPHAVMLAPDTVTKLYRVTARYVYALDRPPRVGETPAMGGVPFATLPKADSKVQSHKLFRGSTTHTISK